MRKLKISCRRLLPSLVPSLEFGLALISVANLVPSLISCLMPGLVPDRGTWAWGDFSAWSDDRPKMDRLLIGPTYLEIASPSHQKTSFNWYHLSWFQTALQSTCLRRNSNSRSVKNIRVRMVPALIYSSSWTCFIFVRYFFPCVSKPFPRRMLP